MLFSYKSFYIERSEIDNKENVSDSKGKTDSSLNDSLSTRVLIY
jgi:hypothetical protein